MEGYKANDVRLTKCKCWNVIAIAAVHKNAFYANKPMLLAAGHYDPATRPVYNDILNRYMPNSQRLLFLKKAHGPLISHEGNQIIADFLNNPFEKIKSKNPDILVK